MRNNHAWSKSDPNDMLLDVCELVWGGGGGLLLIFDLRQ